MRYVDSPLLNLDEVICYLENHEKDFPIPLTKKVNIREYVLKINKLGKSLICYDENKIAGLIFYYVNNLKDKRGFISLVIVGNNYRNQGIAKSMLRLVFNDMKENGMEWCDIPTHSSNNKAIRLYSSLGGIRDDNMAKNGNIILVKKL